MRAVCLAQGKCRLRFRVLSCLVFPARPASPEPHDAAGGPIPGSVATHLLFCVTTQEMPFPTPGEGSWRQAESGEADLGETQSSRPLAVLERAYRRASCQRSSLAVQEGFGLEKDTEEWLVKHQVG
jgi:hypothetical protein